VPADPEKGYGWKRLFAEQLAIYYYEEFNLDIRILRFHNIYGHLSADGRIRRRICSGSWREGEQACSFCHIDNCLEWLVRVMDSSYVLTPNLGTDKLVDCNQFVGMVWDVSGKSLTKDHDLTKPQRSRDRKFSLAGSGWLGTLNLLESRDGTNTLIDLKRAYQARPIYSSQPDIDSQVSLSQAWALPLTTVFSK
jgi:nucleoside-diphosphate-sugar epimerase